MTSPPAIEVPVHQDLLQYTAAFILKKFGPQAPDFSNLFVLLPHAHLTQAFNQQLYASLNKKLPAIIPPWAGTLKSWTTDFSRNARPEFDIISEYARQLLFIDALQQHPGLFKQENQWQVTQALLSLFDELSLNQKDIFSSPEAWQQQLQAAYGINQPSTFEHLVNESKLVYTLWHAWQQQLNENSLYDETADYISRLTNAADSVDPQHTFICLGLSQYTKTEQDFIQHLINNNQCQLIDFEQSISENTGSKHLFSAFIRESFMQSAEPIQKRAQQYIKKYLQTDANALPFSCYLAASDEQQIRAIDYFVRSRLLNGRINIAIISEDRKLSRRLRALLERANIQLQDKAGWSLATTQAATIIERWLECIEEDFSAYPLLDCLKSPYLGIKSDTPEAKENFQENIYRFEHDLIFHENVSSNIRQYKNKLKERLNRLSHWPTKTYDELLKLLNTIQQIAEPLSALYEQSRSANKSILLSDFLAALNESLEQLGVIDGYHNDEAGLLLLKTFDTLKHSITFSNPALSWSDCRTWLGMALEAQHFTPTTEHSNVQLMTLAQASHQQFDCIIIAAAESQHFPGSPNNDPFFNQAVRASLELNTWEQQRQQRQQLFHRVLLSAPEVLLTACNEEKGEEKPVSPWLELLINFHQLAYNKKPDNPYLQQLVQSNSEISRDHLAALPEPSIQPSPALPQTLVPQRISASSYQRLINCPYQYFSADALALKPLEELSDELKKSDYGERIHLILQSFHNGHKKYGKAFKPAITAANRSDAESHLMRLSKKIFLLDLENNVLHRSWLYRWQKHIPAYINWQIHHQNEWNIFLSEKNLETDLENDDHHWQIYGRLDRIDRKKENNTHAIIDYKTGRTARQDEVDIGENVQLSTYALLDADASEVSYLSVDSSNQKVESKASLSGEELELNREENKQRLSLIFKQMKHGQALPAWGDQNVCNYCDFSGLCRKAEWSA